MGSASAGTSEGRLTRRIAVTRALAFKPPYDWPAIIGFFATRAIAGVESVTPDRYVRSIAVGDATGTIVVRPDGGSPALTVTLHVPDTTAHPTILRRLRRMFDLDADPDAIGAHLSQDALLGPIVAARPGLRVPGAWDAFELAVRAILGQQITVAGARALAGKLVATHGECIAPPGDPDIAAVTRLFPHPSRIAADASLSLTLGMPRSRGAALTSLAAAVAEDPTLLAPGGGLEATIARLRRLPGIGEWTAHYIAMRALREPDAFPGADIGLLRAMATAEGRPSVAALRARAEQWRPFRAYAAQHLWTAGR